MARHGGWYNQPKRHTLAAMGIKTGRSARRHKTPLKSVHDEADAHEKKIRKVQNWLENMVGKMKAHVKELEEEHDLEAILIDGGTMDTEIRVGDIRSPTKYEDVTVSPEFDYLAKAVADDVDMSEAEVEEMFEAGVFYDLQNDIRILTAQETALEYIADKGFRED